MAIAKQIGRSALALTLISLSGCQLFQSRTEAKISPFVTNDHAQIVALIRDQMDMYLSYEGRGHFLNQMLVALESDTRDRFKGKDPDTYVWWNIQVQPNEWHQAEVIRLKEEGVETYHKLEFIDVPYRSKTTIHLRSKPSLEGEELSLINKGEVFNVIAQVSDVPWFVVEQKGVIKGYIHKDYARSNVGERDILSTPPNLLLSQSEVGNNSYGDSYNLTGSYTCRVLSYELSKEGEFTSGSFRACRKQRKIWYIDSSRPKNSHPS
ncbi:SH3 domain-containing protein [Vibrio sp. YIC-376]|uniref:SH3 domain-containing protein n=1 Tax=Vibrio sp. YIC-376 TaxID=3136162 RepID=UPI00402AF4A0